MAVLLPTGWENFAQGDDVCMPGALTLVKSSTSPDGLNNMSCIDGVVEVIITVSGGLAPYTWGTTAGILTPNSDTEMVLTPPVNTGASAPGSAYEIAAKFCAWGGFNDCVCQYYGCNDLPVSSCTGIGCGPCAAPGGNCSGGSDGDTKFATTDAPSACTDSLPTYSSACEGLLALHNVCDVRSAGMVDAGCNPCGISMVNGAIVTVTDSLGNSVFVEISA